VFPLHMILKIYSVSFFTSPGRITRVVEWEYCGFRDDWTSFHLWSKVVSVVMGFMLGTEKNLDTIADMPNLGRMSSSTHSEKLISTVCAPDQMPQVFSKIVDNVIQAMGKAGHCVVNAKQTTCVNRRYKDVLND
jgi:hypothetical protein